MFCYKATTVWFLWSNNYPACTLVTWVVKNRNINNRLGYTLHTHIYIYIVPNYFFGPMKRYCILYFSTRAIDKNNYFKRFYLPTKKKPPQTRVVECENKKISMHIIPPIRKKRGKTIAFLITLTSSDLLKCLRLFVCIRPDAMRTFCNCT